MKKRKIAVLGLGPAGGIFATHLAAAGHMVYGVDVWEEHLDETGKNGLKITNLTSLHSQLREVSTHLDRLHEKEFDYVALAVKTPIMPTVVSHIKDLPGDFQVIVLQNGLDNEEYLADFFPRERILRVAVNYAGNIVSPGIIRMNFFARPNQVGCICNQSGCRHAEEIARLMTDAALDTEAVPDIRKFTLKKVILHAILAPVSAILGVTMADVMEHSSSRSIVECLIRECIAVGKAMGYDYGENFFDQCVNFLLKAGRHKPSMLIDLESGNPTEVEYIGGKIVYFGEKYNIPVPVNTTITQLVRTKDHYFCK
jgi:2-dehydropantoate 2-reductase